MKKNLIYLFAAVIFMAVSLPIKAAGAEAFNIDEKGTLTITSGQAAGDGVSTFQFDLNVDSPDAVKVEFQFRENGAKVQEFRYNPEGKKLSVYVAGTAALFKADTTPLTVGQVVTLDGGGNAAAASVSVEENSFRYVYGTELKQGTNMQLPGTVQIGTRATDAKPPQEDDDDLQEEVPGNSGIPQVNLSWASTVNTPVGNASQGNSYIPPTANLLQGNAGTIAMGNPSQGNENIPWVTNPPQGSGGSISVGNPSQGNENVPRVTNPPQGSTGNTPTPKPTQGNTPKPSQGNTPTSNPPQGSSGGSQGNDGSQGKQPQTGSDASSSVQTSGKLDDAQNTVKSGEGSGSIFMMVIMIVLVVVTVLVIASAVAAVVSINKKNRR